MGNLAVGNKTALTDNDAFDKNSVCGECRVKGADDRMKLITVSYFIFFERPLFALSHAE